MKILALIPARGQSKRLPGKNIRPLVGKPLICWTLDTARDVPEICDRLVSTDDEAIAAVARGAGAMVPWLRPSELATDTATSADVALHALTWYEKHAGHPVDGLLLLQPTSPFRTAATVRRGIEQFGRTGCEPVVAVSPTHAHPAWTFTIDAGRLVPWLGEGTPPDRSQDLAPCFVVNGCLYLIGPAQLRAGRTFLPAGATPLVIESPREQLDIDTPWDWALAERLAGMAPHDQQV
jgi:CMP-N,N'-diacetyllegionaminic acid synthase